MRPLTYATVCSGVECMGAAVADLPMRPVFFAEIEPWNPEETTEPIETKGIAA